jgi:hypothetical protein
MTLSARWGRNNKIPVYDLAASYRPATKEAYPKYFIDFVHPVPANYSLLAGLAAEAFTLLSEELLEHSE